MQYTIDARGAQQLYRSWLELRAGGNAKWFLEDLHYIVPENAQRIVEASAQSRYFDVACDWTELAKDADDPFRFVEQALRKHGVDLAIERPQPPSPSPEPSPEREPAPRVPRRSVGGPAPTAFTSDLPCIVKAVDAWRADTDLGSTPGTVEVPPGTLWCVRPAELLFGDDLGAWLSAVDGQVRGLDVRVTVGDDDLRALLGNAELEVLLVGHGTTIGVLAEELHAHPSLTMVSLPELGDDAAAIATALATLPRLRIIDMRENTDSFSATSLAHLASAERVTALRLGWFDDALAETLATFRQLRTLDFSVCDRELAPDTFNALAALPALEVLVAPGSTGSADVIAAMAALPQLKTLDLRAATGLEPSELGPLASSTVQTLHLPELTDLDALAALATMPHLTTLDVAEPGFDDNVGDVLAKFAQLRNVYVGNDDDLVATLTARFPGVRFASRP